MAILQAISAPPLANLHDDGYLRSGYSRVAEARGGEAAYTGDSAVKVIVTFWDVNGF